MEIIFFTTITLAILAILLWLSFSIQKDINKDLLELVKILRDRIEVIEANKSSRK